MRGINVLIRAAFVAAVVGACSSQPPASGLDQASPTISASAIAQPTGVATLVTTPPPPVEPTRRPRPRATTVLPATPSPAPSPDENGWIDFGTVSDRGYTDPALVIDGEGFAHVVATSRQGGEIFYLTNSSGEWTRERLSRPPRNLEDDSAAVTIDATDGSLWTVFSRRSSVTAPNFSLGLYIANNRGGTWSEPELYSAGGEEPSLLVRRGAVNLAFNDHNSVGAEDLDDVTRPVYATNLSGSWVETPLANIGRALAIEQSADGRLSVIVAAWEGGQSDDAHAYIATQSGGGADFELAEVPGVEAGGHTFDGGFGRHGQPFVSWSAGRGDEPRSSVFTDGSWTQPQNGRIEAVDSVGGTHVLTVEPLGPCCDGAELWYRTSRSDSASRVLFAGSVGIWPALALDEQNRPHVFLTGSESQYLIGPAS